MKSLFIIFIGLIVYLTVNCLPHHGKHGHSQVKVVDCDDTINGIGIDWDGEDDKINEERYKCLSKKEFDISKPFIKELCATPLQGYHLCLHDKIVYNETVPTGGPHRPVWVTYGEYLYMPPQRWVHAIEHGAAAFLYNPCANETEIETLKKLAKSCLRKHVITPYENLPQGELFNVVTFGCRLRMNQVTGHEEDIKDYLRRHAVRDGPEWPMVEDGDYKFGILEKAKVISDMSDSKICPQ